MRPKVPARFPWLTALIPPVSSRRASACEKKLGASEWGEQRPDTHFLLGRGGLPANTWGAPSGRSRQREGRVRSGSPARGPCRPGDRPRDLVHRADSEAEDERAGWAALGLATSSLTCSGSRPALAPRRRRRTPQPRCGSGSRCSLPVSYTGFFLLVTKTYAAAEHAQSSHPRSRRSCERSCAPDFIKNGRGRGKEAVQEGRRG